MSTHKKMAYGVLYPIPDQSRSRKNGNICLKMFGRIDLNWEIFYGEFSLGHCVPLSSTIRSYTYSVGKSQSQKWSSFHIPEKNITTMSRLNRSTQIV